MNEMNGHDIEDLRPGMTATFSKTITEADIVLFAGVSGDNNAVHLNEEFAAASPFGGRIAHGFLTLSLIPALSKDNFRVQGAKLVINYGLNKVRFLNAVPVGARIRVRSELADATPRGDGDTVDLAVRHTVEIEGVDKPAAVAEMIARVLF